MNETTLPRTLAIILLLLSLAMLIPLGIAVASMLRGQPVPTEQWTVPLVILATGAALTYLLSVRELGLRLFVPAMALWMVAAGYFLFLR